MSDEPEDGYEDLKSRASSMSRRGFAELCAKYREDGRITLGEHRALLRGWARAGRPRRTRTSSYRITGRGIR